MSLAVGSPVAGSTMSMTEVPDDVFAQAMVGPGIAIQPPAGRGDAVAPIDGTVVTLHPHAFVVANDDGRGVLVHLGIDTVRLHGEGFTVHVAKGDAVRAGQPLVNWDPAAAAAAEYSPIVPVVALDATADDLAEFARTAEVSVGDTLFVWG